MSADVLCCSDCGTPLEVVCPNGHADAAERAFPVAPKRAAHTGRKWQAKSDRVCACGRTFTPTGPRHVECHAPDCKAMREAKT